MKKLIFTAAIASTILASCGSKADPKEYAKAYCDCLKGKDDATGTTKANLDACFEEVNGKVGKVQKEDIPEFRKQLKETECQIEGMGE